MTTQVEVEGSGAVLEEGETDAEEVETEITILGEVDLDLEEGTEMILEPKGDQETEKDSTTVVIMGLKDLGLVGEVPVALQEAITLRNGELAQVQVAKDIERTTTCLQNSMQRLMKLRSMPGRVASSYLRKETD